MLTFPTGLYNPNDTSCQPLAHELAYTARIHRSQASPPQFSVSFVYDADKARDDALREAIWKLLHE